ncbi:MAG: bacillithiol biosynthesis cysteine-adding enzyme BshC [Chitinophagales bacterium]
MANIFTHVPYAETGYFSHLVTDYLSSHPDIKPFYQYEPDAQGIAQAINERTKFPVNRKALVAALTKQYADLPKHDKAEENIRLLLKENTFTVCTAHQPNLLTGYLYFIYKILHAIKLAEELSAQHPDKHFVPVYYMGSEDNDIEELGVFRFRGEKYVWDGSGQHGAVGRMDTAGLKPMLNDLFKLFGPPGKNCDDLQDLLTKAYLEHKTIAAATHYLVNELFGRYGLVVLNPDEATLKASFAPVMEDELLNQHSFPIITKQIEKLGGHYKIQAHPRIINLFYLNDQLRERIEKKGDKWVVVNTGIQWTQQEVIDELKQYPERFSPNVMLRGLYQETILPNVAFIGGGAEVAYWLQLKTLFEYYKVFFPSVHLRQSVLWINNTQSKLRKQLELSVPDIFKPELQLVRDYISKHSTDQWQTQDETIAIEKILQGLKQKATSLDPTLRSAAEAALTKIRRQLSLLEKKMLRAEKKKMQTQLLKISRLKNILFPANSLQERVENFSEYYLQYGASFFDTIKDGIKSLKKELLVVE